MQGEGELNTLQRPTTFYWTVRKGPMLVAMPEEQLKCRRANYCFSGGVAGTATQRYHSCGLVQDRVIELPLPLKFHVCLHESFFMLV